MTRQFVLLVLLGCAALIGCGGDGAKPTPDACTGLLCDGPKSSTKDLTSFAFLDGPNAALSADVTATINGSEIAATVPSGTNVTALVATFATTGRTVAVGGVVQESGVAARDFSSPVVYIVTAEDGTTQAYNVTITVAGGSSKDLTAFSFTDATNAALSADVTATINGTAIAATVPSGTNVTALVATFSTTGTSVKVGATTQVSATTANNFTSPVMYVVSAGDGSMKTYTVTVTIAANSAKDLTAFSFLDATNAALSADVTATINGTAIAATVPAGTNVTALVATFTTTGASVKVGATTQVSGTTANDFTNPVMYVVTAADNSMKTYTVTVTIAASAAKDITAFSFTDATNTALSADVTATINGTAIAATVPAGTDVTALVATFTTTGMSVKVGATTQSSGITPNDFTNPVMYVVTAADNSTKTYAVTVTIAAPITIPSGTYAWGTWICTRGATVIDIKAFAVGLGIMEVDTIYNGATGRVDVIYSATCTRTTNLTSVTYPMSMQVQTVTENMVSCTATCPGGQCTPGAAPVITDVFDFTLSGATTINFSRTFPSGGVTLQSAAGCMPGDIESGTDIKQ